MGNSSQTLPKYEDILKNLKSNLNQYLKISNGMKIKNFSLNQKNINDDGFENRLIEAQLNPQQLLKEIKSSYLSRDYLEGEIGTIDGDEQYDGIFNIALNMLLSNRLAKHYKHELEKNSNLDVTSKQDYEQKVKHFMAKKRESLVDLISTLFVYSETENDNDFFYGHTLDVNDLNSFVIDLPRYSQISVHFGSESHLEYVQKLAKQKITLILQKKLELNQISKKQYNVISNKANVSGVLPEYSGKLYEYSSAIPLDFQGRNFARAQRDLNLSKKLITDYTKSDISEISRNGKYNSRELYYWAVKSDFSKSQLESLSVFLQERDNRSLSRNSSLRSAGIDRPASAESIANLINTMSTGRKAVASTTAKERKTVSSHEKSKSVYVVNNRRNGDNGR